jgi:hypothetical protein
VASLPTSTVLIAQPIAIAKAPAIARAIAIAIAKAIAPAIARAIAIPIAKAIAKAIAIPIAVSVATATCAQAVTLGVTGVHKQKVAMTYEVTWRHCPPPPRALPKS